MHSDKIYTKDEVYKYVFDGKKPEEKEEKNEKSHQKKMPKMKVMKIMEILMMSKKKKVGVRIITIMKNL